MLVAFVVALALAARAYPGGNWIDRSAPGHDLWRNYWCDLMREQAVNGDENAASYVWAKAAFYLFGVALLLFWPLAARLVPVSGVRRLMVVLGRAGALGTLLVPVFTYDDFREWHAISTSLAGAFSLVAIVALIVGSRSVRAGRARQLCGVVLAVFVLANLWVYVPIMVAGGGHDVRLPVVQKLGTVAALAWIAVTSRAAARVGVSTDATS
jgi:hypothetical protein